MSVEASSQMMTSLIPIYAAVVAALHFTVGSEVGAFIMESLANTLCNAVLDDRQLVEHHQAQPDAALVVPHVGSKVPNNALLLLVYMYNMRVVHHMLIVDIMNLLVGSFASLPGSQVPVVDAGNLPLGELEVELLCCLVDHCGPLLRADDPLAVKNAILKLNKRAASLSSSSSSRCRALRSLAPRCPTRSLRGA